MKKSQKIIIFDLDETLGYFTQLNLIWNDLINRTNISPSQNNFFLLCDCFNEYFRKNIFEILKFIHMKKKKKLIDKCIIYTNNNGDPSWTYLLKDYMEHKIKVKLFDLCICAYNKNNVDNKRTTPFKCISDLEKILKINIEKTNICFIDDKEHPDMEHPHTFYIKIHPYYKEFNFTDINTKFKKCPFGTKFENDNELNKFLEILKETINNNKLNLYNIDTSTPRKIKEGNLLFSKLYHFILN